MSSFFVDLNHLDLMAISGEESTKFLQGQLTCDVESLENGQSCLGAACDNKGRIYSSFRLTNLDKTYYFELQTGLLDSFKAVLDKYAVFYKAESSNAGPTFRRFGLMGEKSRQLLTELFPILPEKNDQLIRYEGMYLLKLSESLHRYQLWLEPTKQDAIFAQLEKNLAQKKFTDWEIPDLQAGIYQISPEDIGLYTPQILNYDISGVVNFSKGCYTGQEIVARMHYRGKPKKRLYHLTIDSEIVPEPGSAITSNNGEKLGNLIKLLQTTKGNYEALAILNVNCASEAEQQSLVLENSPKSKTTLSPLIYN